MPKKKEKNMETYIEIRKVDGKIAVLKTETGHYILSDSGEWVEYRSYEKIESTFTVKE